MSLLTSSPGMENLIVTLVVIGLYWFIFTEEV